MVAASLFRFRWCCLLGCCFLDEMLVVHRNMRWGSVRRLLQYQLARSPDKHVRVIFWIERSQIMYPRLVPLLLLGVVNQQVIEGRLQIGQVLFDDIAG